MQIPAIASDAPGCSAQSSGFRDANAEFARLGAVVLGISILDGMIAMHWPKAAGSESHAQEVLERLRGTLAQ